MRPRYRVFRDHAGRVHRVQKTRDEIVSGRLYWAGVTAVSIVFLIVSCAAAGVM